MGRRTTFKRCTACKFTSVIFYVVQVIWTIIFLAVMSKVLRLLTFEPKPVGTVNEDWSWLWASYIVFAVLSAMQMLVSVVLSVATVAHWWLTSKTIPEYEGLKPKRSLLARMTYFVTMLAYFLLCCAALVMFGMAMASALNLSGKFGRPTTASYSACDPLDDSACAFPFPSSHFLVNDSSSKTGFRVSFGAKSLPKTMDGGRISPTYWNELDGFSTIAPLLFHLRGATNATFVSYEHIERSLDITSSTLIINVLTGQLMPHWTEIDQVKPEQPSIIIQPASPLDHATQYLVVVKNIKDAKGIPLPRSIAFNALMSDQRAAWKYGPSERYDKYHWHLIPLMTRLGISVSDVQLAWDFVTVSSETNHGRFEKMRSIALDYYPTLKIIKDDTFEHGCTSGSGHSGIGRAITAKLSAPNFLAKREKRGGFLPREPVDKKAKGDAVHSRRGTIKTYGETSTYVQIQIPCSLTQRERPQPASKIVQYGHGLFGSRAEVQSGWIGPWLDRTKMVFFASDWYGMSKFDRLKIAKLVLSDMSSFASIAEMTLQGWANLVVVQKAIRPGGVLAQFLANSGISIVPPDGDIAYYGISQGGVVGGGYVASNPFIKRAALGVPGSPFALLLTRSHDFDMFKALFELSMFEWRDIRLALSLMQQLWDQGESAGWLHYMNRITPPSVPKKSVLVQDAHGDAQVTILGAHIMARAYNGSNITPAPFTNIFGLPNANSVSEVRIKSTKEISENGEISSEFGNYANEIVQTASALTEWKYENVPPMPFSNIAPLFEFDTHECIRSESESQDQIYNFFTTGIISQTCPGPRGCTKATCAYLEAKRAKMKKSTATVSKTKSSPEAIGESLDLALLSATPAAKLIYYGQHVDTEPELEMEYLTEAP